MEVTASPHTLGKYALIAELGHGGMADVFLAMVGGPTGSGFTKLAVIKRLRPNLVEDPEFVAMLVDEARISARLNHPNVIQTIEVGVEAEEYYLAMEFLEGQPLHRVQRRAAKLGTPMPRDLEYLVIADALAGLHHAHELADYDGTPLGIVHRDVTPQNVFVTYDGTVKVVDFGIAKAAGRASETKQGIVKGKVRYMSPEQALGEQIDRRSDIFAVGQLLWEAATGRRFWTATDDLSIIQALVAGQFNPSPRAVDPRVPAEIDAICRKALAPHPDDRYATAAELHEDLEAFLADHIVTARRRLGVFVAKLFEKERADLRQVIERASRVGRDQPSVALLMGSSTTTLILSSASAATIRPAATTAVTYGASLAPVDLASRPGMGSGSSLVPPRRAPRFGSAAVLGLVAVVASCLVIASQIRNPEPVAAASTSGARATAQAVEARTDAVMSSTARKWLASSAEAVNAAAPAAPAAQVTRFAAPPPASTNAVAASSRTTTPGPDGSRPDGNRRRARPSLDTTDPWGDPSPN